jgi:hypothetical protein
MLAALTLGTGLGMRHSMEHVLRPSRGLSVGQYRLTRENTGGRGGTRTPDICLVRAIPTPRSGALNHKTAGHEGCGGSSSAAS